MRKQIATVGLSAALVAGGAGALALTGAGTSSAQTTPDTTTSEPSGRRADHAARLAETLQPLVDDGTLTQDQADAVVAALEAARPDKEMGPGGRGGPGRRVGLDAAATALGVTQEELMTALRDGQSIADVAASKGVDVQVVIDAMVADAQAHLAEEVASGEITQDQADARLAELTTRLTEMVNSTMPMGPGGPGGPGGRGGPRGPGGPGHGHGDDAETADDGPDTTTPSGLTTGSAASVRPV